MTSMGGVLRCLSTGLMAVKFTIDDDYLFHGGDMSFAYLGGVLAIDGVSPVRITGNNELFEAAVERARSQRTGR